MRKIALFFMPVIAVFICQTGQLVAQQGRIEMVAESKNQWTGITISKEGRIFVNFPRWSDNVPVSVGELVDGQVKPYPDNFWNDWREGDATNDNFVCVQSVYIDGENNLWVLDPSSPNMKGVTGKAKLVCFNLSSNTLLKTYEFDETVAPKTSYLNDVRIDNANSVAYITDSGEGAIVVLDLNSGEARRVLDDHESTEAKLTSIEVEGKTVARKINSDGIELSSDGRFLYYIPLMSETLYRIPTEILKDKHAMENEIAFRVEKVKDIGVTDGILFDSKGNLFIGGIRENSVKMLDASGQQLTTVVQDAQIKWPDTFARNAQDEIFFTTSQIHLPVEERETYRIFRILK